MPQVSRYAIYYSPDPGSPLDTFGKAWFGQGVSKLATKLDRAAIDRITQTPRRYGFHGTLKPPFALRSTATLEGLSAAAHIFARSTASVEIPPLELAVIGKFIALTPSVESAALEKLASACVRAFEAYRAPVTPAQITEYKRNKLTVHQEQMLEHWGYPYVMEEFRFHMSITDRIDDDAERDFVMAELERMTAPLRATPIAVSALTLFHQAGRDQPMAPIERIPFGRRA